MDCSAPPPMLKAPFTSYQLAFGARMISIYRNIFGAQELLVVDDGEYGDDPGVSIYSFAEDATMSCIEHASVGGSYPTAAAMGTINLDGRPDLVVTRNSDHSVVVMTGLAGGGFSGPVATPTGSQPRSVVLAKLDGDGRPDVAVGGASGVTVHRNDGNGHLLPGVTYGVGGTVVRLFAVDLNQDGALDLVASPGSSSMAILVGNGDATFQPAAFVATGPQDDAAVADLNGDAKLDLLTLNATAQRVEVRFGVGDGTFDATPTLVPTGVWPSALTVTDLDRDGRLDIVVSRYSYVDVCRNLGGTFAAPATYSAGGTLGPIVPADVDFDGHDDLVVLSNPGATYGTEVSLNLLVAGPGGELGSHWKVETSPGSSFVAIDDFDGDGRNDLAVVGGTAVDLFPGLPGGGLGARRSTPVPLSPRDRAIGDVNRDGLLDVVTLCDAAVVAYLGQSGGPFAAPIVSPLTGLTISRIALGDVTGDGRPDAVIAQARIGEGFVILPGHDDGTFGPAATVNAYATIALALVDFDRDGRLDIVAGLPGQLGVGTYRNDGGGNFTSVGRIFGCAEPWYLVMADMNRDTWPDIVIGAPVSCGPVDCIDTRAVCVASSNGAGTFGESGPSSPAGSSGVAVGDLNLDGFPDVVQGDITSHTVSVLLGGSGPLSQRSRYGTGGGGDVAVGDLTNDGYPDVAVANEGNTATILTNTLKILAVPPAEAASAARAWIEPNPARNRVVLHLSLRAPTSMRISVRDLQGRELRSLSRGVVPAGSPSFEWDLRDHRGTRVSPGIYFVAVDGAGSLLSRRVIVLGER